MVEVEWQIGGPRLEDAEQRHDEIGRARQRECDDSLGPGASGAKVRGESRRPLVQFGVGEVRDCAPASTAVAAGARAACSANSATTFVSGTGWSVALASSMRARSPSSRIFSAPMGRSGSASASPSSVSRWTSSASMRSSSNSSRRNVASTVMPCGRTNASSDRSKCVVPLWMCVQLDVTPGRSSSPISCARNRSIVSKNADRPRPRAGRSSWTIRSYGNVWCAKPSVTVRPVRRSASRNVGEPEGRCAARACCRSCRRAARFQRAPGSSPPNRWQRRPRRCSGAAGRRSPPS